MATEQEIAAQQKADADAAKIASDNAAAMAKAEADVKAAEDAAKKAEAETLAEEEATRKALANIGKSASEQDDEMLAKLVKDRVDSELKIIKSNLDKAYAERDSVLKKNAEFEQKERDAVLKRLEEEGKHKEAFDLRTAELQAQLEAERKRNTELSRDSAVKTALSVHTFRNAAAADMAYREVISQLVQDKDGQWIHRSGINIPNFVEAFSKLEDMSFLFKVKVSSGAGTKEGSSSSGSDKPKSLFQMTQAEVIKLAAEGKLPQKQGRR
jgi:hypothetical protein